MRVLVIGVGNLGSRHAQALAKLTQLQEIILIEPDQKSLEIAVGRLASTGFNGKIHSRPVLELDQGELDLAVVSTSSRERLEAFRLVLRHSKPKNVLLEKLLAPSQAELDIMRTLIDAAPGKIWVNCPMPYYPHYQRIERELRGSHLPDPLTYQVFAGNYGLVSSSIHYLDHFTKLTQSKIIDLNFGPDSRLVESKRMGYSEVVGSLLGTTEKGDTINIIFNEKIYQKSLGVEIRKGSTFWRVDEVELTLTSNFSSEVGIVESIAIPKQSELTHVSLNALIVTESPYWATASSSVELHSWLYKAISKIPSMPKNLSFT